MGKKRSRKKPPPRREPKRSNRASASSSRSCRPAAPRQPPPFPSPKQAARIDELLQRGRAICDELSGLLARVGAAQMDLGGPGWTAMNHVANASLSLRNAMMWRAGDYW